MLICDYVFNYDNFVNMVADDPLYMEEFGSVRYFGPKIGRVEEYDSIQILFCK